MQRRAIVFVACLVAGLDVWAGTEYPARPGEQVAANEFIVRLTPGAAMGPILAGAVPGALVQALGRERIFRISVPGGIPNGVMARLAANPQVDYVEPNRLRYAVVAAPNDPNYPSSWWFQTIEALPAWSLLPGQYLTSAAAGSGRVKVAVLDTGADCTHPDFVNTGGSSTDSAQGGQLMFSASQAFVATTISSPVCAWQDDHGHGTHVTGILAAATSNAVGVSGLGYPVQVVEYKVLDSTGTGSDLTIANAIMAAADAGAQVVSMSLGGAGYSQTLQTAINYAWQKNTLVVAAAGNDASSSLFFPAGANHAVGVSATDSGNNLASFSNFGNAVQLAAPGVAILSTAPTYTVSTGWHNYVSLSGTSMATPFVSALAGLVAMSTPNTTSQAILQRMEQTANSTTVGGGWGQNFGFGIIDAANAVAGSFRTATNGAIAGQIVDTSGNPVNGAHVTINNQTVTTDSSGLYRFGTLPAGTYPVTVSAIRFATQSLTATVAPGADTPFTVTMGVTYGKFTGTVTDQSVGVAGAIMQALSSGLITSVAVADLNGEYTLWVPGGTYDVQASAIGRSTATVSALTVSAGGTTAADLILPRMGIIAGSVLDGNLNPVANAQVLVTGGSFSAAAATDASGNYSLIGVPDGTYSATATATGFLGSTQNAIAVSADVTTNVNFTMVSSTVATPTFNPPGGSYSSAQSVTISTATSGATIRYTTDGSTPTSSVGTLYSGPVSVSSSLTLKAIAYMAGMSDSLVASAAYTITGGGGGPSWYNPSWTNRKAITIDHTKVSGASSLTNFPMLFSVTDANLKSVANGGSVGKLDGTDILFTDSSGTLKINHELESYNPVTGQVIAWVQVPSLSPTADTVIYIYYGNAAAADQQNKTGVWDSNYKAVWHLPNGATLSTSDSTANANDGNNNGATAAAGWVDGGGNFNGSSAFVSIPASSFPVYPVSGSTAAYTLTFSTWFKSTAGGVILGQERGGVLPPASPTGWVPAVYLDNTGHLRASLFWHSTHSVNVSPGTYNDGNWHQVVATSNNGTETLYVDGDPVSSQTGLVEFGFNSSYLYLLGTGFGQNWPGVPGGWFYFNGALDEMRVSANVRSSDWILTGFRNQSAPGTFSASGAQESSGGGGQVATPAFNPPGGSYSSAQSVTISTTTAGATIRYTTDGSTPTSSVGTVYVGPVAVSSSLTLKGHRLQDRHDRQPGGNGRLHHYRRRRWRTELVQPLLDQSQGHHHRSHQSVRGIQLDQLPHAVFGDRRQPEECGQRRQRGQTRRHRHPVHRLQRHPQNQSRAGKLQPGHRAGDRLGPGPFAISHRRYGHLHLLRQRRGSRSAEQDRRVGQQLQGRLASTQRRDAIHIRFHRQYQRWQQQWGYSRRGMGRWRWRLQWVQRLRLDSRQQFPGLPGVRQHCGLHTDLQHLVQEHGRRGDSGSGRRRSLATRFPPRIRACHLPGQHRSPASLPVLARHFFGQL